MEYHRQGGAAQLRHLQQAVKGMGEHVWIAGIVLTLKTIRQSSPTADQHEVLPLLLQAMRVCRQQAKPAVFSALAAPPVVICDMTECVTWL